MGKTIEVESALLLKKRYMDSAQCQHNLKLLSTYTRPTIQHRSNKKSLLLGGFLQAYFFLTLSFNMDISSEALFNAGLTSLHASVPLFANPGSEPSSRCSAPDF